MTDLQKRFRYKKSGRIQTLGKTNSFKTLGEGFLLEFFFDIFNNSKI